MKNTWGVVNELLGKRETKRLVRPTKLNSYRNGSSVTHTDTTDIVEDFNDFFVEIGESLANKIQTSGNCIFETFLGDSNQHSIFLKPVTEREVEDTISSLDINKATGWDKIDAKLLHYATPHVSKPLCYIINLSFSSGCFPDCLKIARVLPLFQKGNHEDPSNYRPISILPTLSKVFEKVMSKRIVDFFKSK